LIKTEQHTALRNVSFEISKVECDRCGTYLYADLTGKFPESNGWSYLMPAAYGHGTVTVKRELDLCPDCTLAVEVFVKTAGLK
jgi:hypothetical protein